MVLTAKSQKSLIFPSCTIKSGFEVWPKHESTQIFNSLLSSLLNQKLCQVPLIDGSIDGVGQNVCQAQGGTSLFSSLSFIKSIILPSMVDRELVDYTFMQTKLTLKFFNCNNLYRLYPELSYLLTNYSIINYIVTFDFLYSIPSSKQDWLKRNIHIFL